MTDDIHKANAIRAWELVKEHGGVRKASALTGIKRTTLATRYRVAIDHYGKPDFNLKAARIWMSQPDMETPEARREIRDAAFWRNKATELQKQLASAEHIAEELAGVRGQKIVIPDWIIKRGASKPGRAVLGILLSDIHAGEVVSGDELNGLNEYNIDICRRRLRRLFNAAGDIGPRWLADCKCQGVLLALGGDLVSGSIREELRITNELVAHEQVRFVVEEVSAGIRSLAERFGRVHVASVPGNHARPFEKPTAKLLSRLSYDTQIASMIQDRFEGDDRITFQIGTSMDQMIPVFGWSIHLTHGDNTGSRGGQGFAGPDLPIIRGSKKISEQQGSVGRRVHYQLLAHMHFSTNPHNVLSNGSVVGYSEYAQTLRVPIQPPKQWMFLLHEKWGLRERLDVQLEEAPSPEKPRFRVPSWSAPQ